jgi:hypothetical protein
VGLLFGGRGYLPGTFDSTTYNDLSIYGPADVATHPSAPSGVSAVPGNASALVSWTAPASTGGSPITGYTATSSPGTQTCTTSGALSCTVSGLTNGTPYTFTVTATNAVGPGPASAASLAVTPFGSSAGATYVSLAPARILDTRSNTGLSGAFTSASPRSLQVTGVASVPSNAIAVTGNLTVTNQTSPGFVALTTVSTPAPATSTLNFPVGDNRANGVTAPLGSGGVLWITYMGSVGGATTDLLFDVTGYFVP